MSQPIDRAGNFRGLITACGIQEGKDSSQSVAVGVTVEIHDWWNSEAQSWEDWRTFQFEATGFLYVIKKDGSVNDGVVKALIEHANWPNDLTATVGNGWEPTPCSFSVESNTYKEKTNFRIGSFMRAYDAVPGAEIATVSVDRAKQLQSRHGAALRAIGGNVKRNAAPAPANRPAPPPPPVNAEAKEEVIPF